MISEVRKLILAVQKSKPLMSENSCSHCKKTQNTESVCRMCCRAYFHQRCIKSLQLSCCPYCGLDSQRNNSQTLLWTPVVSLLGDDETDRCPAKRRRVEGGDGDTCVICLDDSSKMDKVVTTNSCCKQTANVACLRVDSYLSKSKRV